MNKFNENQAVEVKLQQGYVPAIIISGPHPGVAQRPEDWYWLKLTDGRWITATTSHIQKAPNTHAVHKTRVRAAEVEAKQAKAARKDMKVAKAAEKKRAERAAAPPPPPVKKPKLVLKKKGGKK